MLSYSDFYILAWAVRQGILSQKQVLQALRKSSATSKGVGKILCEEGQLTPAQWKRLRAESGQISKKSPSPVFFNWENGQIVKAMKEVLPRQKLQTLFELVQVANQKGAPALLEISRHEAFPRSLLSRHLGITFQDQLKCSHGHGPFVVDYHCPWRQYPCPFCGSELSPETNSRRETEVQNIEKKSIKSSVDDLTPGTVVGGKYEIIEKLGQGGMGAVYKAYDPGLDRQVAIKIASSEKMKESLWQRFQREMKLSARLNHPCIVPVYNWGKIGGSPFLVMGFIEGKDLRRFVEERGKLSQQKALQIAIEVGKALVHAHEKGIVHRDLKPENIMIDGQERAHLMDFGLAREEREKDVSLTQTGAIVGSPQFMAPEQALGKKAVDGRADIYALGGVLYYMLAGRPPFEEREILSLLRAVTEKDPRPLQRVRKGVTPEVNTIVHKCLKKNPLDRYQQAEEVLADLLGVLEGRGISARPDSLGKKILTWTRQNLSSVLVVFLSLAVVLLTFILLGTPGKEGGQDGTDRSKEEVEKREKLARGQQLLASAKKALSQDEFESALSQLDKAEKLIPSSPPLFLVKGKTYRMMGKRERAIQAFKEALKRDPKLEEAYSYLGAIHYERNEFDQAGKYYRQLLKIKPTDLTGRINLGTIYLSRNNHQKALDCLNHAIKYYPRKSSQPYYLRSTVYFHKEEYTKALKDINQAIKMETKKEYYCLRGRIYKELGKVKKAWRDLTKTLEKDPNYGLALLRRGELAIGHEALREQGIADLKKYIQIHGPGAEVYNLLGRAYEEKWEANKALQYYNQALKLDAELAEAYNNRGSLFFKNKKYTYALRDYNKALEIRPRYFEALINRCNVYLYQKKYRRALGDATRAVKINPRSSLARILKGRCYYYLRKWNLALKELDMALTAGKHLDTIYMLRGTIYRHLGKKDKALENWEKFLELFPEHKMAPQIKRLIKKYLKDG